MEENYEEAKAALLLDIQNADEEKFKVIAATINMGIALTAMIGSIAEAKERILAMGINASDADFMAGADMQHFGQFFTVRVVPTTQEEAEERERQVKEQGVNMDDLPKPTTH